MKKIIAILLLNFSLTQVKADELRVAITNIPPFSYVEDQQFKGFHIDILHQIEHNSGLKFNYTLYPHARITTYLEGSNPDLFILSRIICDRSDKYEVQETLYRIRPAIMVKQSVYKKNRNNYRIGRLLGTCTELFKKYVGKLGTDVTSMEQAADMLKTNRLDGICSITPIINYAFNRKNYKEKLVMHKQQPDTPLFDAVICRKKDLSPQIKRKLEAASKTIKIPDMGI